MILVDTPVWIGHFRTGEAVLARLLSEGQVLAHPFVAAELACGNLKNRKLILADLNELLLAVSATHEEVLRLIEDRKMWGKGIGWIEAHLLASSLLSACRLWTLDQHLSRAAADAGVEMYRNHHDRRSPAWNRAWSSSLRKPDAPRLPTMHPGRGILPGGVEER